MVTYLTIIGDAMHNDFDLSAALIQLRNSQPKSFTRLFLEAATLGKTAVVKTLISAGAGVNDSDSDRDTALIRATHHGHIEMTKLLIEEGAHVNGPDRDGCTALIWAALHDRIEIAKLLI